MGFIRKKMFREISKEKLKKNGERDTNYMLLLARLANG